MNAPVERQGSRRAVKREDDDNYFKIDPCYICGARATKKRYLMLERRTGKWRCVTPCAPTVDVEPGQREECDDGA